MQILIQWVRLGPENLTTPGDSEAVYLQTTLCLANAQDT